ncbi:hypothetical protein FKG94_01360 [Exilibacterium tricleocarpae]|uniref:ADP-ribosylglycohydrolase family protein n=1 Tax=Exilibacterium tricleocarpae TaxID=2591008 RepID=A0A545U9T0_9GAMM|nr:ADP-ribosylglycohydrolase family protein [Exilibacterium tricleocarpae]TQV86228.1 hypothetical protein FKG94_01360 [Exilibacterium tricleocarpae]
MTSIDKYKGCFLGLAVGDAFGAPYEGGLLERLLWKAIGKTRDGKLRYTDDTQMAIDLAESFLHNSAIEQDHLAYRFAQSYQWSRGYGPSTSRLLKLIKKGKNWRDANKKKFKTGSFGNGAAMRAPILAMCFPSNTLALLNNVTKSAEITHAHPLGIEGAKLIALATQAAFRDLENEAILMKLLHQCQSRIYKNKITFCAEALNRSEKKIKEIKRNLGNGIAAPQSCVTAIYFSLKFRDQKFESMLSQIFTLGGDVDTIASMAGAIWGAFNGASTLEEKSKSLEQSQEITWLAKTLFLKQHHSLF